VRRCAAAHGRILPEDIGLLSKLAFRSGLGDRTAVPPRPVEMVLDREKYGTGHTVKPGIEMARDEYAETCFQCVDALFAKTGINPSKVKFVITNSSLFNPTPSLSAAIINRFGLRDDTVNYSLGGMGCSGEAALSAEEVVAQGTRGK
jgi:3-ketoacyl-CoA synthase